MVKEASEESVGKMAADVIRRIWWMKRTLEETMLLQIDLSEVGNNT